MEWERDKCLEAISGFCGGEEGRKLWKIWLILNNPLTDRIFSEDTYATGPLLDSIFIRVGDNSLVFIVF